MNRSRETAGPLLRPGPGGNGRPGLTSAEGPAARSAAPAGSDPAQRFADAWDEFVLAVRRAQARGQRGSDELTLAQYYLLAPLMQKRAVPISRLADAAAVSGPIATRLVDGLERAGLVTREASSRDRRTVLISITPSGRKVYGRRRRQLAARRRALYERLEPEERERGEQLLRHLAELLGEL